MQAELPRQPSARRSVSLLEVVVGVVEGLHLLLGDLVEFLAEVPDLVGVVLHAETAVGGLDLRKIRPFFETEQLEALPFFLRIAEPGGARPARPRVFRFGDALVESGDLEVAGNVTHQFELAPADMIVGKEDLVDQVEEEEAGLVGEAAAEVYDLSPLRRNIEDAPGNTTRFVVLGRSSPPPSGRDVTSLMFTTPNRPGALHDVLTVLAAADISMTRIESRPLRQEAWDYVFFVDIEGHADTESVRDALDHLQDKTSLLKILGAYPRAVL